MTTEATEARPVFDLQGITPNTLFRYGHEIGMVTQTKDGETITVFYIGSYPLGIDSFQRGKDKKKIIDEVAAYQAGARGNVQYSLGPDIDTHTLQVKSVSDPEKVSSIGVFADNLVEARNVVVAQEPYPAWAIKGSSEHHELFCAQLNTAIAQSVAV